MLRVNAAGWKLGSEASASIPPVSGSITTTAPAFAMRVRLVFGSYTPRACRMPRSGATQLAGVESPFW